MIEGYWTDAITLADVIAAKPEMIYYGATTCWWTHDPAHLNPGPPPRDPRGGVLFQTDDIEGFLAAAEQNPQHYGKHRLIAFMAAHHSNCERAKDDPRPWCFRTWDEYNEMLDRVEGNNDEDS